MTDLAEEPHQLLCSDCAAESGDADDQHVVPPMGDGPSIACERCSAILVGFFYRVPRDAAGGMAPGAG
ncbi:MAG: hypothetical protein JWM86_1044 [Thermoleophilia bacterium]|nr:hypothetical protein [Thermoleophilia bacterium]